MANGNVYTGQGGHSFFIRLILTFSAVCAEKGRRLVLHSLRRAPSPSKGAGILETETLALGMPSPRTPPLKSDKRKTSFSSKARGNPCPLRERRQRKAASTSLTSARALIGKWYGAQTSVIYLFFFPLGALSL